jgi:hypothetical protein
LFYGMSVKNFIVLLCGRSKTCLKLGEKNVWVEWMIYSSLFVTNTFTQL